MNQTNPQILETVADALLARVQEEMTPEQQQAYKENIKVLFLSRLGLTLIEALSKEDRVQYEEQFVSTQLVNTPEAQAFLASKLPLMEELLTEESKQFINEFIEQNN